MNHLNLLIGISGGAAYFILYAVALTLALIMNANKKASAAIVSIFFALPLAIAGALVGITEGYDWVTKSRESFACSGAAGEERIERTHDDVEGFALALEYGKYTPWPFSDLRNPATVLRPGYGFAQYGRERVVDASVSHAVSVEADPAGLHSVRLETSVGSGQHDPYRVTLTVLDQKGETMGRKGWLVKRGTGELCPKLSKDSPLGTNAAMEFVARVLKPAATTRESSPRYRVTTEVEVLRDFPARMSTDKIQQARLRPSTCPHGFAIGNAWRSPNEEGIDRPRLLRVAEQGEVRVLYARGRGVQTLCTRDEVYLVADVGDHPNMLTIFRMKRPLTLTQTYIVHLKGSELGVPAALTPQMLDFSVDAKAVRLTRVHLYAPVSLGEPSARVARAYKAKLDLPVPEGATLEAR